jgi:predicted nucleic acid-binding protein
VFVDSSYWVAICDRRDQWHRRASELVGNVVSGAHLLDLTAAEAITIVGSRQGGKPAQRLFQVFLDSCSMVYLDLELMELAMERHLRHDGRLSLADCATVEAMVRADDRAILSFDSDFDLIHGLSRIH